MAQLLHLDSSARRNSFSRQLTARFAESWRAAHPGAGYTYRDLAADPVPLIGEAWTEICDHLLTPRHHRTRAVPRGGAHRRAARGLGGHLTAAHRAAGRGPRADRRADVQLLVPAALKTWIDQVTFPRCRWQGGRSWWSTRVEARTNRAPRARRSTTRSGTCATSSPGTTTSPTSPLSTPS